MAMILALSLIICFMAIKKNSNINVCLDCWRTLCSISDPSAPSEVMSARSSLFMVIVKALREPSIYLVEYSKK